MNKAVAGPAPFSISVSKSVYGRFFGLGALYQLHAYAQPSSIRTVLRNKSMKLSVEVKNFYEEHRNIYSAYVNDIIRRDL